MAQLKVEGLNKRFGGVCALNDVTLSIQPGTILGLVGENGAGKSTFLNILAGNLRPDSGLISVNDQSFARIKPLQAQTLGIHVVYQDLALCDDLNAAQNIFLGDEPTHFGLIDDRLMQTQANELLEALGITLNTEVPVRRLSGGQRQAIAFTRAMRKQPTLLLLDEPTAAMGIEQTEATLKFIQNFKRQGASVVLISHHLEGVMRIADSIAVLKHGALVHHAPTHELSREQVIDLMTRA